MVSWDRAFGTAVKIVLGSAAWYIIGILVALVFIILGDGPVISTIISHPTAFLSPNALLPTIGQIIIVVVIGFVAGGIIASLGVIATFLKYPAELIADEVHGRNDMMLLRPTQASNLAATSKLKVCRSCGGENPVRDAYCGSCGIRLD
jgi:hypothetical protein